MIFPTPSVAADEPTRPPSTRARRLRRHLEALHPDGPSRRLHDLGASALSVRELLTLLLDPGRGRERADQAAAALMASSVGPDDRVRLRAIGSAPLAAVAQAAGIGHAPAARVAAAFELGRRMAGEQDLDRSCISTARDVYELMRLRLQDLAQEELHALLVDTHNQLIRDVLVSRGTLDAAIAHPRDIFRPAIQDAAAAVILVHNHPSGEPSPSPADHMMTRQVARAGQLIGIPVLDHVIVGERRYHSFAEAGILPDGLDGPG